MDHGSQKLATAGPAPLETREKRLVVESGPPSRSRRWRGQGSSSYGSRQRRARLNSRQDSDGAKTPRTADQAALLARAEARLNGMKTYKVKDLPTGAGQWPASARGRHPAIDQARSQGGSVGMVERSQQGA